MILPFDIKRSPLLRAHSQYALRGIKYTTYRQVYPMALIAKVLVYTVYY